MTPPILGHSAHDIRRYLQRPACPRCGDTLMAAAASELVGRSCIRNSWSCESCGHHFVTAVRLGELD